MEFEDKTQQEKFDYWLEDYLQRSQDAAGALGDIFMKAMELSLSHGQDNVMHKNKSLEFLKAKREEFPFKIIYFLYSSRFDKTVESEVFDTEDKRAAFDADYNSEITPEQLMQRKVSLLDRAFNALSLMADVISGHYTVVLSDHQMLRKFPLAWEFETEEESQTGFSADLMWQTNFQYLCELADAIVAYGGVSSSFLDELTYISNRPDLDKRLLWLDQDLKLCFPKDPDTSWGLNEIDTVLKKIES